MKNNTHLLDPHTWHAPSGYRCHTASSDCRSHCPRSTWSRSDSSYLMKERAIWKRLALTKIGNDDKAGDGSFINPPLTQLIEFWTVWTESFVVVPLSVPTLPWCDATAFTPDACHTNLHRNQHIRSSNHCILISASSQYMSQSLIMFSKKHETYPSFPLLVLFWIVGSQTGSMITVLTSITLQQWLRETWKV